jgi:hypothetical protein
VVECLLAKENVASSNLVSRSIYRQHRLAEPVLFFRPNTRTTGGVTGARDIISRMVSCAENARIAHVPAILIHRISAVWRQI